MAVALGGCLWNFMVACEGNTINVCSLKQFVVRATSKWHLFSSTKSYTIKLHCMVKTEM